MLSFGFNLENVWKCTFLALDGINFAKDYEKDSYNKRIFIKKL
jgi:hypothetical protein